MKKKKEKKIKFPKLAKKTCIGCGCPCHQNHPVPQWPQNPNTYPLPNYPTYPTYPPQWPIIWS